MKVKISAILFGCGLLLVMINLAWSQEPQPRSRADAPLLRERPLSQPEFDLTPEMEQEALEYLARLNPHGAEELRTIKTINPKVYTDRLRQLFREKYQLERLQKENPARFERESKIRELERQSHELGESYRKAQDEAARKTLRSNLASVITQLFDLREMNRQEEVKRMEAELKRLKDTLAQRQKNRADIIERRIQQLTGEAGAMEWE